MFLYTVHATSDNPVLDDGTPIGRLVDAYGIADRLGFSPRWCSGLYKDSLADSWFSIWVASPHIAETINLIESDEAIPIDALEWTRVLREHGDATDGGPGWRDEFERIFDVGGLPRWRLEYLAPDSPETTRALPVKLLTEELVTRAADVLGKLAGFGEEHVEVLQYALEYVDACARDEFMRAGLQEPVDAASAYSLCVQTSGVAALLWMLGVKGGLDLALCNIGINELASSGACFERAQLLRQMWDAAPHGCTAGDFEEMRDCFVSALGGAAHALYAEGMPDVGRDEPCVCGSGLRFGECHGGTHGIDWYVGLGE